MIRKLRSLAARGILLVVIVAGLGFGILATAMAVVIGGLMLVGIRLAQAPVGPITPREPHGADAGFGAAGETAAISA